MINIKEILKAVSKYANDSDCDIIYKAYTFSKDAHYGQLRLSGEPYLSHPLEVAGILTNMKLDTVSIASGLLHDVIEDTRVSEKDIDFFFGSNINHIVCGVTKLSKLRFYNSKDRAAESFRKMLLAMVDDIRVVLIKLADRLHNIRTLDFHIDEAKKKYIAKETLEIYAPIALRLGIYWIKTELENISLKYLNKKCFYNIKKLIKKDKKKRKSYIITVKKCIKEALNSNNIECITSGRYKSIYSIYQKMGKQSISFKNVYDVIAFRIILKTSEDCYNAMGYMHGRWKPVPERIKDYIGMPKSNMYQSLHTTVVGPSGRRIEIQIRTKEMDKIAESGIAAHWSYKEGKTTTKSSADTFKWVQKVIENQKYVSSPDELLETLKIDLFPEDVYVLTPNGDIKALPKGATPVDFAYSIHSEVGNKCTGCKVNGRMVSLKHELKNGEEIKILTTKNHEPTKDWLKFVKTVKAKSRIRQWIKTNEHTRSLYLGREMCEKAFNKEKINFSSLIKEENTLKIIKSFGLHTIDDLMLNIGHGKVTTKQFVTKIKEYKSKKNNQSILNKIIQKVKLINKTKDELTIDGHDNMLIKFGKCCQPIPGDSVIGYITRGHGITIHRTSCANVNKINSERKIIAKWGEITKEIYPVNIVVNSIDRIGLLADIARHISNAGANIIDARIKTKDGSYTSCYFTISTKNTKDLQKLMLYLKKIKHVINVERIS